MSRRRPDHLSENAVDWLLYLRRIVRETARLRRIEPASRYTHTQARRKGMELAYRGVMRRIEKLAGVKVGSGKTGTGKAVANG